MKSLDIAAGGSLFVEAIGSSASQSVDFRYEE